MTEPRKSKEWRLAMAIALQWVGNGTYYWSAIADIIEKAGIEQADAMRVMDQLIDLRDEWLKVH